MTVDEGERLARSLYPALATGDRDALDELLHPDFIGETTRGLPMGLGGRYDGPAAMRRDFWGAIARAYVATAEPLEIQALADDRVLVVGRYTGMARATGTKFEADFVHIIAVRDGRIAALTQLTDSAAWEAALRPVESGASASARAEAAYTTLTYTLSDGLAHIELSRGDAANAINPAMTRDLRAVADQCAADGVRAALITGLGDRFCAGGDINVFASTTHAALPHVLDHMITNYHIALDTLAHLDAPVICAVQGAAAGGGLGLLFASDIVIASDDAKFALGYGVLGLSSDGANTWYLPRLVGPAKAAQMFLENRVLTAQEAEMIGLVSEIVPAAEVSTHARAIAERLAVGPTKAFADMRRLLRGAWTASLTDHFDAERRSVVRLAATHDAAEGIAAFIQKRSPAFDGS
jgi:2-(1,2-epoxy-1,2-dihydrophenyl)acetyl-CoA isomerase